MPLGPALPEQFTLVDAVGGGGGTASITLPVPASALVGYVIDQVNYSILNQTAGLVVFTLTISDSQGQNYVQGNGVNLELLAPSNARDSDSLTGPIVIIPGRGFTVAFTALAGASEAQQLTVIGHVV